MVFKILKPNGTLSENNVAMKCIICGNVKSKNLFKKFNYQIAQCKTCHFILTNPSPNRRQLNIYYKKFDYETGFINESLIRKDSIRTLNNLKILGYNGGLLLDIGCGAGFFIDEARKQGWIVQGIDTSEVTTNYGINRLKLEIINADFLKYKFTNSKFRVITLFQVIEHIVNPKPLLNKIYHLLESDGIICVATPNIESYLAKILQNDFNYIIPPEHVSYYSPTTLIKLLENVKFRILKIETWGYSTDLAAILKKIIKGNNSHSINTDIALNKQNVSLFKKIKSILFDNIFCKIFYSFLNYNYGGSMIEIYAVKEK